MSEKAGSGFVKGNLIWNHYYLLGGIRFVELKAVLGFQTNAPVFSLAAEALCGRFFIFAVPADAGFAEFGRIPF